MPDPVPAPLILVLALLTCMAPPVVGEDEDGRLKRARDEVRPRPPAPPPPASGSGDTQPHHHGGHHHHHHRTRGGWTLFGWFAADPTDDSVGSGTGPRGLLAYPYADGQRGWLVRNLDAPADPTVPATVRVRGVGGAIRGEYTDAGDGLRRYTGAAQVSFSQLRLESEWQRYIEHLPGDRTDTLTLGTIGLAVAFPVENALTLLIGGGISTYHDTIGSESGWYLKAGLEAFPIRPLVLNAEVWGGYIREDEYDTETALGGGRATAGVIWNRIEVFGGWQATWIGSVTLDGPTAGLRVWF